MTAGMCLRHLLLPLLACADIVFRFANSTLPEEKVIPYLSNLIQTYLETMNSIGAETWIMHGSLLSWWWNQKVCKGLACEVYLYMLMLSRSFPGTTI